MTVAFAEGAVTRLRREFKLLLDPRSANELRIRLGGESGSTTRITSVYFDRPGLPFTRRARNAPDDCLKIRTKEYFPDQGARGARVVLEAKRERGGLTQKQRVWISRASLGPLLKRGALWRRLPVVDPGVLIPVLGVTYVREVYQPAESWRVTLDREVSFHPICEAQAFGRRRLRPEHLGAAVSREERVVVEVKHLGAELPEWLSELQRDRTQRFSKFSEGMRRIEEAGVLSAQGG